MFPAYKPQILCTLKEFVFLIKLCFICVEQSAGTIAMYLGGGFKIPMKLQAMSVTVRCDEKHYQSFLLVELIIACETFLCMMEDTTLCHILVGTVFQLHGAPPYFSHCVYAFLESKFQDHWIGGGGPIPWPPCSPDYTPLDFF